MESKYKFIRSCTYQDPTVKVKKADSHKLPFVVVSLPTWNFFFFYFLFTTSFPLSATEITSSAMEHFNTSFHFPWLLSLLIMELAMSLGAAAASVKDHQLEVVPPISLLCISECSTCPVICSPPPTPPSVVKSSPPQSPPVVHSPPPVYYTVNPSPPRPTPSRSPSPPSPPPPAPSSHPPPPPAFKYYFNLPPPPPTTPAAHGNTNAYNYYFYASKSSSLSLPAASFCVLFLFHLMLPRW